MDLPFTRWLRGRGPGWPAAPGFHTRAGDLSWCGGAPWTYDGSRWTVRLAHGPPGFAGRGWALGLLHVLPAETMPLVHRDLGGRWVVQLSIEGREVRTVEDELGVAVASALLEGYPMAEDGR